jgi:hypothetical protein
MNPLFEKITHALQSHPAENELFDLTETPSITAAIINPDEPIALHKGRRRVKECHTSHWDLDYLPREDAEKILADDEP